MGTIISYIIHDDTSKDMVGQYVYIKAPLYRISPCVSLINYALRMLKECKLIIYIYIYNYKFKLRVIFC